jgi:hypothetical protein
VVSTVLRKVLLSEFKKKKKTSANISTLLIYKQIRFSLRGWNSGYCKLADLCRGRVEVPHTASSQSNGTVNLGSRRFVRGRSRHPIIWAVGQKFQIRALRLCVQQFHLLPLISDTNPDDQHVSPQGTHFFLPSIFLTVPRIELYFRPNLLIRYKLLSSGGK